MRDLEVYTGAALLGGLAGLRSMSAPAVLGQLSRKGALTGVTGPLALVTSSKFGTASSLLAVTELIGDKLPFTPNRTAVGPLVARALAGGLGGAVICSAKKRSVLAGALLGAAAAIGAAYGGYELRKRAGSKLHVPDAVIALAEDALVGAVSIALTSRLGKPDDSIA